MTWLRRLHRSLAARTRRHWRAILFSLALTVVLLEVALRVSTLLPSSTPLFRSDRELGLRVRPGVAMTGEPTNSRGFNDREWGPPAPGGRRLAVIGDSFVFGVVARRDNLASQLAALAGDGGGDGDLEVLNLGIPAIGPRAYVGLVAGDAAELGAGVACVVFFVGNDVEQLHPDFRTTIWLGSPRQVLRRPFDLRLTPGRIYLFRLARSAARLLRHRLAGDADRPAAPARPAPPRAVPPPAAAPPRAAAPPPAAPARAALPAAAPPRAAGPQRGTFPREVYLEVERQRLEVARREPNEVFTAAYAELDAWVADLRRAAEEAGVELLVVLAPDHFQVDAELRRAVAARFGLDLADFDLGLPQRRLTAALERGGVASLDLLPVFRRRGGGRLYLPDDSHWNAAGNRVAAEAIWTKLAARELIARGLVDDDAQGGVAEVGARAPAAVLEGAEQP